MRWSLVLLGVGGLVLGLLGCSDDETYPGNPGGTTTATGTTTGVGGGTTTGTGSVTGGWGGAASFARFAVIGDFGDDSDSEAAVASLVASWNPDFVLTAGDNNYPEGSAATIDANIGKHYHQFIGNYSGAFGPGSPTNRFWPTPGNHDWYTANLQPYLDYFTLPGNERYYEVDLGLVHVFAVDSDPSEPDGTSSNSTQGTWLQGQLGASSACWNVVVFHHAAYSSSSTHGSTIGMRWPFEQWGADVVMSGHDHTYERLQVGGIPYFVNGIGGAGLYAFGTPTAESQVRYNDRHGAMLVTASTTQIVYELYSDDGVQHDQHVVAKDCN